MPNYGQLANLTFEPAGGSGQPAAYVWELWDGQIRATIAPLLQKPYNRQQANVAVTVVDAHGQAARRVAVLGVTYAPTFVRGSFGTPPKTLPYTVQLEVSADDPGQVAVEWRNSAGTALPNGGNNPFSYQVTAERTVIMVRVYKVSDTSSYFYLELVLAGLANRAPVASPISAGVKPTAWAAKLPVVSAATTANMVLAGLTAVDGVTPVSGARILVKDQSDPALNGVYAASAGSWARTPDALANGSIVKVAAGAQAGRTYVLILDKPDAYSSGDPVIFERLASSYDGRNRANAKLVVDCAALEVDGETLALAKVIVGASGSASGLARKRVLSRTVVDTSAVDLGGLGVKLFDAQATWTDSNGIPRATATKSALAVVA